MTKKNVVLGCAMAAVLAGTAAWAGSRYVGPVTINLSAKEAYGTLGSARNSQDALQFITCDAHAFNDGSKHMSCTAKNASGTSVYCTSTVPVLVETARSLSGDAFVFFEWDASGACTYLGVGHSSEFEPKRP
ncbi:hypothetical protein F0U60_32485 [Archangium minus]|uniref:DUF4333 domain-containing protein n=1 Tax=Archangium minus TaxID=83450 RepID=A0ABY9WYV3_9BACT|nr:hypothetical protein F0U60_32485 [Archangium minus]